METSLVLSQGMMAVHSEGNLFKAFAPPLPPLYPQQFVSMSQLQIGNQGSPCLPPPAYHMHQQLQQQLHGHQWTSQPNQYQHQHQHLPLFNFQLSGSSGTQVPNACNTTPSQLSKHCHTIKHANCKVPDGAKKCVNICSDIKDKQDKQDAGQHDEPNKRMGTHVTPPRSDCGASFVTSTLTTTKISDSNMPVTTVCTTTTVTSSMMVCGEVTQATKSATTTTSITVDDCDITTKWKKTEETNDDEDNVNKRRNLSNDGLMERVLTEVMGIKNMVGDLNIKVSKIQEETKDWKKELSEVTREIGEVKESVNMAHNLICDETKAWIDSDKTLKNELLE